MLNYIHICSEIVIEWFMNVEGDTSQHRAKEFGYFPVDN